jgi:hypothetical protein
VLFIYISSKSSRPLDQKRQTRSCKQTPILNYECELCRVGRFLSVTEYSYYITK